MIYAHKLFTVRADGTLGSLFINRRARLPIGEWMQAESIPTKGFALRPGWHATAEPDAPHLSTQGREWRRVLIDGCVPHVRPESQGGLWYTAERCFILPNPNQRRAGK